MIIPTPATTGFTARPMPRAGLDVQVGLVPGHNLSSSVVESPDGNSIEQVGFFNPRATGGETRIRLDLGRIDYWTGQGAQVSDRVKTLVAGYRKQAAA